MNKNWLAAGLVFCLIVVVGGLTAGGLLAASAGRDLTPAGATMIATISGGLLAAVATYIGGKDVPYEPPPIPVATDVVPAAPSAPTPASDEATGVEALAPVELVSQEPVVDESFAYEDDESQAEDVTSAFVDGQTT